MRAARDIHWVREPSDEGDGGGGGTLNACFNAADRHVALGRADQPAVITARAGEAGEVLDFARLTERTAQLAGALRLLGVRAGDPVELDVPLSADGVVSALACARIGAPYRCLPSPADRMPRPPAIVTTPDGVQIATPTGDRFDFESLMRSSAIAPTECVPVAADQPICWEPNGSRARGTAEFALGVHQAARGLGIRPGDIVLPFSAASARIGTDLAVWGPLLVGAATVLLPAEPDARPGTAELLARLIDALGATVVLLADRSDAALLPDAAPRAQSASSVRLVTVIGSGPLVGR